MAKRPQYAKFRSTLFVGVKHMSKPIVPANIADMMAAICIDRMAGFAGAGFAESSFKNYCFFAANSSSVVIPSSRSCLYCFSFDASMVFLPFGAWASEPPDLLAIAVSLAQMTAVLALRRARRRIHYRRRSSNFVEQQTLARLCLFGRVERAEEGSSAIPAGRMV